MLKRIIEKGEFDIVHCHTPVGAMIGRLASIKSRKGKTQVIYTAHGLHFFKGAPLKNWILYYPVEKILSKYTDDMILINKEDYLLAKSKFHAKRFHYIPGVGINLDDFKFEKSLRERKRKELELGNNTIVFLSVGELNKNKNHKVVIKALGELKQKGKLNDFIYLICGLGKERDNLMATAKEYGINNNLKLLGYRTDINEICVASDLFIFPSLREGLPVSLMEALASGLPVICSNIRGNKDLVKNEVNGLLYNNMDELEYSIEKLIHDKRMLFKIKNNTIRNIQPFKLENIMKDYSNVYNLWR